MRLNSFETTTVQETPASMRDELLACQHPTDSVGDEVHMDADYVFDASVDDSVNQDTRDLCTQVLREKPNSYMFIFMP